MNLDEYIYKVETLSIKGGVVYNSAFINRPTATVSELIENVWTIMGNIANGLDFLHGWAIVHRDVKPRNSTLLLCVK